MMTRLFLFFGSLSTDWCAGSRIYDTGFETARDAFCIESAGV